MSAQNEDRADTNELLRHLPPAAANWSGTEGVPVVFERGEGVHLIDTEGRRYLDMGMLKNPLGHAPPAISELLSRQATEPWEAEELLSRPVGRAAARVAEELPSGLDRVALYPSGSEALEAALSLARGASGPRRRRGIAAAGSYHGWTLGGLMASGHPAGTRVRPAWLGPALWTLPRNVDDLPGDTPADPGAESLAELERLLEEDRSIGTCLLEPVLATAGLFGPPPGFAEGVRAILDRHEVLLIADEVSIGGWRGAGFLMVPELRPDIVIIGKGVGAGLGAAALCAGAELYDRCATPPPLRVNALAAAVVEGVLDEAQRLRLPEEVPRRAALLAAGLVELREQRHELVHARARGLMGAVELRGPQAEERAARAARGCLERGLRVVRSRASLLLLPALVAREEHITQALEVLADAIDSSA